MKSILTSVKKVNGISESDTTFDSEIILHTNTVFSVLCQLGVGPANGFSIEDASALWTDFIPESSPKYKKINDVKSYVGLRVRLVFDPPTSSSLLTAMKEEVKELEWRINVEAETKETE